MTYGVFRALGEPLWSIRSGVRLPIAGPSCAREEGFVSDLEPGATVRAKSRPSRALMASVKAEAHAPPGRHRRTRGERLARQRPGALDRASGRVARALGLTESRITQVTALLGLSPALQEAVLLGEGGIGIREAIRGGRKAEWER